MEVFAFIRLSLNVCFESLRISSDRNDRKAAMLQAREAVGLKEDANDDED